MGIGSYATQSLDGTIDLSLMPVTLGLRVSLDGLYDQPWVVPYGSAGLYLMSYNEKQANSVVDGNTQLAAYAKAGLLILLDWIDPEEARVAFEDSSIDNTYFFIEGRMFFASSELVDPDFESDLHLNAGLVVEFY